MLRFFTFFIFIISINILESKNIDSLVSTFNNRVDKGIINDSTYTLAEKIGEYLSNENITKGNEFAINLKKLAVELDDKYFHLNAYITTGRLYKNNGNYNKALENYLKAFEIAKETDYSGYGWAVIMTGNLFYDREIYDKAEEYYFRSIKIFKNLLDKKPDDHTALDSLNYYDGQAVALNNIALIKKNYGKLDEAENYHNKAYKLRDSADNAIGRAYHHFYIADIQKTKGEYKQALNNITKAKVIFDSLLAKNRDIYPSNNALASLNSLKAEIFSLKGQNIKAKEFYQKAIDLLIANNNTSEEIQIYFQLCQMYKNLGDKQKAIRSAKKALSLSRKYNSGKLTQRSLYKIAVLYKYFNNYYKSSEFFTAHLKLTDSLERAKSSQSMQLIENNVIAEEKIKNMEKIKQDRQIQGLQLKKQNYFILLLAVLVVFLIIFAIYAIRTNSFRKRTNEMLKTKNEELTETNKKLIQSREELAKNYRKLQVSQEKLQEANATKDKFFSIIAHDLKNPIGTLKNSMEVLTMMYDKIPDEERFDYVNELNNSTKVLYSLLENLLTWSRSQSNKIQYQPETVNLDILVKNTISVLNTFAAKKGIKIENKINSNMHTFADPNMISTVIRNLLSNGLKFTPKNGLVIINANRSEKKDKIVFSVADSGIGMPPDKINDLFRIDMSYSTPGTNNERGTGLGLILCKEFIDKHNGDIWVESTEGEGSVFYFTLQASNDQ